MALMICPHCGGSLQGIKKDDVMKYRCPMCSAVFDELPEPKEKYGKPKKKGW